MRRVLTHRWHGLAQVAGAYLGIVGNLGVGTGGRVVLTGLGEDVTQPERDTLGEGAATGGGLALLGDVRGVHGVLEGGREVDEEGAAVVIEAVHEGLESATELGRRLVALDRQAQHVVGCGDVLKGGGSVGDDCRGRGRDDDRRGRLLGGGRGLVGGRVGGRRLGGGLNGEVGKRGVDGGGMTWRRLDKLDARLLLLHGRVGRRLLGREEELDRLWRRRLDGRLGVMKLLDRGGKRGHDLLLLSDEGVVLVLKLLLLLVQGLLQLQGGSNDGVVAALTRGLGGRRGGGGGGGRGLGLLLRAKTANDGQHRHGIIAERLLELHELR